MLNKYYGRARSEWHNNRINNYEQQFALEKLSQFQLSERIECSDGARSASEYWQTGYKSQVSVDFPLTGVSVRYIVDSCQSSIDNANMMIIRHCLSN